MHSRDVPHFAAGAGLALAVEVDVRAAASASSSGQRSTSSPMRLSIAAPRPVSAVEPGGRPQIARTCCSNWEVTAPSIVQWPLLWTRGAISLTTGPSALAKNSTVSTPTWPSASAMRRAAARASATCRATAAAARHGRAAQDAVAVHVFAGCPRRRRRRRPSAQGSPRIRPRRQSPPRRWRARCRSLPRPPRASSAERIHAWPLPS